MSIKYMQTEYVLGSGAGSRQIVTMVNNARSVDPAMIGCAGWLGALFYG